MRNVDFGNSLYVARLDDARFWVPNKSGMVWIESVRTYWAAIYHITDRRACSLFSLRSIGCIVVKYSIRLFKCFHFFMAQCDLEVIQGHEKWKCLFVWLFVQLNSVLLRITRMRYSFQCSYARLPLDDNHKMKWAYSEFFSILALNSHFPFTSDSFYVLFSWQTRNVLFVHFNQFIPSSRPSKIISYKKTCFYYAGILQLVSYRMNHTSVYFLVSWCCLTN